MWGTATWGHEHFSPEEKPSLLRLQTLVALPSLCQTPVHLFLPSFVLKPGVEFCNPLLAFFPYFSVSLVVSASSPGTEFFSRIYNKQWALSSLCHWQDELWPSSIFSWETPSRAAQTALELPSGWQYHLFSLLLAWQMFTQVFLFKICLALAPFALGLLSHLLH